MGLLSRMRVMLGRGGGEIVRLHRDLEGMLALREAAWLYRAAADPRCREIVEIGSYRGKSCVILARGSLSAGGPGACITAIDPHRVGRDSPRFEFRQCDREAFLRAIQVHGVAHLVNEVVATSCDALARWEGRAIDLLWIDGDHSEEAVRFDIEGWGRFVRVGGVIAAHDYKRRFPGVVRAWDDLIRARREWGPTRRVRSLVWARRVSAGGA